jgi:PPOX class probable F420-dependent enzyme
MPLTEREIDAFLNARRNAIMGVNRPGGAAQLTPVWFLWRDGAFYISTTRDRRKFRLLERDPRVTLCVDDPMTFTSVIAEGIVEVREDDIGAMTEEIYSRYLDRQFVETMLQRVSSEPRVLLVLRPQKWLSWDITPRLWMNS